MTIPPAGVAARGPQRGSRAGSAARPLSVTVYEQLRHNIVSLKMAPGTSLVEIDICARLHVSRTPVRAAIERLHQEGLVTMTGSRAIGRAVVAPLTIEDMRELFLLVGALDGTAARLAAALDDMRRTRLVMKGRSINEHLQQLGACDAPASIPQAQELDMQFHKLYEEAAAGPRLMAKLNALHAQRERYVRLYTEAMVQAHRLDESLSEHEAILKAIERGDGDEAEHCAAYNHRHALERYYRIGLMSRVSGLGDLGLT